MLKKRVFVAFLLVVTLVILSSSVFAGCCQGIIGCSRAFFESECSELAAFDSNECEDIQMCDIVACCHNVSTIPKATYRSTCLAMKPAPAVITTIKPFSTNPSSESAEANRRCSGGTVACTYANCEQANSAVCACGGTMTSASSQFCCSKDNSVFPTLGSCVSSPGCKTTNFYRIHGRILTPSGASIEGAEVRAGSKQVISDKNGNYTIDLLPDLSSGTVVATKNNTINSTTYTIKGADVFNVNVVLSIVGKAGVGEDCDNGIDDDGDQFGWDSSKEAGTKVADQCDSECASAFSLPNALKRSVSKTYYNPNGEYYTDAVTGKVVDRCSDRYDNDCNGYEDCEDTVCLSSPACMNTICGDGKIQFPNSKGVYEQCDFYDKDGVALKAGNDSLCPGKCIAPGKTRECTCAYEAGCGNGVIDEPLEDCDGIFLASLDSWDASKYSKSSDCTIDKCGKPGSVAPCKCPPKQLCGNNRKESPEECDGSDSAACKDKCSPDCTCPAKAAVCGNGIIELAEECDGTVDIATATSWDTFKTRKYGCSVPLCAIPKLEKSAGKTYYMLNDYLPAGSTSSYSDYEKSYSLYLDALDVDSACSCRTDCKAEPPGPKVTSVKGAKFRRQIDVNWSDECKEKNAKAYNVLRCEAKDANGTNCNKKDSVYVTITPSPLGLTTTYADKTFQGSTASNPKFYCYYVEGIYDTIQSQKIYPVNFLEKFNASVQCVRAGDEVCFEFYQVYPWANETCAGLNDNVRSTCDENNVLVPVNDTNPVDCNNVEKGVEYLCVGPFTNKAKSSLFGKTACVPKSLCDFCNDPFGIFGYSSGSSGKRWDANPDSSLSKLDFGKAPKKTPTATQMQERSGYTPCVDLDFCYMDYTYTTVNKFYERQKNATCYDYHSLKACQKFNETDGNCQWVWHPEYGELGVGVCRTNITDDQECDRCHDPENEVFGWCDRDSCALYGRCYYDRANLDGEDAAYEALAAMSYSVPVKKAQKGSDAGFYKCTHERKISCESYDSKEDCIGSNSPYSIGGISNLTHDVSVDVYGNLSKTDFNKLRGTNRIINRSDDFFGFGRCQWVESFYNYSDFDDNGKLVQNDSGRLYDPDWCVKNSDGSPQVIVDEKEAVTRIYERSQLSDCGGLVSDGTLQLSSSVVPEIRDCRKDFISPSTSIPHYNNITAPMRIPAKFRFQATVVDKSTNYSTYYPDTYACISNLTRYCYPNGTAKKVGHSAGNLVDYSNIGYNVSYEVNNSMFKTGRYLIRYFSEDISHNLEEVRNFTVFLDADKPNIIFSFANRSYEIYEDEWRTNLTLTMKVVQNYSDDDKYAICSAKMYLGNTSIYPREDIVNEYNNTWTRNYSGMMDDYYIFSYVCRDDVGNEARENITIRIDGDLSITNPQPRVTVNSTNVTISVETGTNAECRYLLSTADDSRFRNASTFDTSIFPAMTAFQFTGSSDLIATTHRSTLALKPGYQRYYVKCRLFYDGKIRGNAADEIRFAVDTQGPTTTHDVDAVPYNGWYNRDILVSISCGDAAIMGAGLDWSFGCNDSYYCIGPGCSSFGKWRNYTSGIGLKETTYVSYYSVDAGGNAGAIVEDTIFEIDKEPPNITVEIYNGKSLAKVLVPATVYKVKVSSSKPLISPAVASPVVVYSSSPSKFAGKVKMFPSLNASVWEGVFYIDFINANAGFEGTGTFTASGSDYHNVSGSGSVKVDIDTKPPGAPVLKPSLESPSKEVSEYYSAGYPINYYNGTYYTAGSSLYITGYTGEFLDMIAVSTADNVDTDQIFTQTETTLLYNDTVISAFKGKHEIKVGGDITSLVNSSMYVGFDKVQAAIGPRTVYGAYGMFYDTTNFIYSGGDNRYTTITLYPGIEKSVALNGSIFFYDKESPSYWFGFNVSLKPFRNTSFYLKAYDEARNIVRYPDISREQPYLVFFSDPVAPSVVSHYPRKGTTSRNSMDVEVVVKEGKQESGIFNRSFAFTVNSKKVGFTIANYTALAAASDNASNYYRVYYRASNLADGAYSVAVTGTDLALNSLSDYTANASWTFTVDRKSPAEPYFTVIGGFEDPFGSGRWFVTKSPDFIVNFSDEENPVTITDVLMSSAPTESGAADCNNVSYNAFLCRFKTPKTALGQFWTDYGVIVKAYKILDDGTRSPTGNWSFDFTVDDQAPLFTLAFQNRFMDNIGLTIASLVTNEKYPLKAKIEILGEEYSPLYSSNNGSFYYLVWPVPDYDSNDEGNTTMRVTFSDFAGNFRSVTVPVFIDLTAPRITNISIDISNTIEIGTELFTAQPNVTVSGPFIDDDIYRVWIEPGDYNMTSKSLEGKKYAALKYERGIPRSFDVSVKLMDPGAGRLLKSPLVYNYMLINQINNLTLYVRDLAGHTSSRKLQVISDVTAPQSPTFCLGADWTSCVPGLVS
jgi:hypothetical protein